MMRKILLFFILVFSTLTVFSQEVYMAKMDETDEIIKITYDENFSCLFYGEKLCDIISHEKDETSVKIKVFLDDEEVSFHFGSEFIIIVGQNVYTTVFYDVLKCT